MKLRGFPEGAVIQRQVGERKKAFKKSNIKNFLGGVMKPGDAVLFFGDNAEIDPEIYLEVGQELSLKDPEIFIRDIRIIKGRYAAVPEALSETEKGIVYYTTETELLAHPRFKETSTPTKDEIRRELTDKGHLPDYVVERVAERLKEACKRGRVPQFYCEGTERALRFIDDVDLQILQEQSETDMDGLNGTIANTPLIPLDEGGSGDKRTE